MSRLEELLAAATPGPWEAWDNFDAPFGYGSVTVDAYGSDALVAKCWPFYGPHGGANEAQNAALVALAPDAVRLLIDMGEYLIAQENDICRDDFYDDTDARRSLLARLDRLGNTT